MLPQNKNYAINNQRKYYQLIYSATISNQIWPIRMWIHRFQIFSSNKFNTFLIKGENVSNYKHSTEWLKNPNWNHKSIMYKHEPFNCFLEIQASQWSLRKWMKRSCVRSIHSLRSRIMFEFMVTNRFGDNCNAFEKIFLKHKLDNET